MEDALDKREADPETAMKLLGMAMEAVVSLWFKRLGRYQPRHKDVLAEAGKKAGLEVEEIGPFSRKLSSSPRFAHRYSNVVRSLFGDSAITEFDVDDATEIKEDSFNEVTLMAVCKKVEKAKIEQISRRQWLAKRKDFAGSQMRAAIDQSFTLEALKKGYGWTPPTYEDPEDQPPTAGSGTDDAKDEGTDEGKTGGGSKNEVKIEVKDTGEAKDKVKDTGEAKAKGEAKDTGEVKAKGEAKDKGEAKEKDKDKDG